MRFRVATIAPMLTISIVIAGACLAGDRVKSGLAVGEPVNPFEVEDITGPNQGKTLCYR